MKQGAHEVTEKVDQVFGQQLPTVDLAQGVERYFEFVQKAVDVNRELATNWADAVNSFSGVVREQTEKVREPTTEQADKVESATREQVDKVEQAEKTQARRPRQATNGHIDLHNDEHNEAFDRHQVDRHRTATPVPHTITGLPPRRGTSAGTGPFGRAHRSGAPRGETSPWR